MKDEHDYTLNQMHLATEYFLLDCIFVIWYYLEFCPVET